MNEKSVPAGFLAVLVFAIVLAAGALRAESLAQVIEAAKKERNLSVKLQGTFTPKSMKRLEREISEKYGVNLDIKLTPTNMSKDIPEVIMEQKAGVPPTYDALNLMSSHITYGIKVGVLEKVDWEPLLAKGTPRNAMLGVPPQDERLFGYGINCFTGRLGLMYNPGKVSAQELPRTLKGLADPKWKDKIGIFNYLNSWARVAFVGGKEKVLSDLRALLKNGALQGRYPDLYNRFVLGEIWLAYTSTAYLKTALDRGMPVAWQGIDPVDVQHFSLVLVKRARHINAAKLLAVYSVTPEGAKFMLEEGNVGNYLYPGNFEYDAHQQEARQGLRHVSAEQRDIVEFELSDESQKWQKEIKLILEMGG